MSTRWAVGFAVSGEARFLSHHDVMRLMERAAARAGLQVSLSQGFNPRPRLSLPLPRPVGVASRCELMVLQLEGQPEPDDLARRLGTELPPGMTVRAAWPLPAGEPLQVLSASYELDLREAEAPQIRQRLDQLRRMPRWEVTRQPAARGRGKRPRPRVLDVKGRVDRLECDGQRLSITLRHSPTGSVRCREVLALVGLAEAEDGTADRAAAAAGQAVARLRRTRLETRPTLAQLAGRNQQA